MPDVFAGHKLALPFRPVADLLAAYAARDPGKTAIVDLDQASTITFGELERVVIDIAANLKRRGVAKGDRVVLLADEIIEKLLIWLGVWRIGAVVCPLNVELNSEHVAALTEMIGPKLILVHKDLDAAALAKGATAPSCASAAFEGRRPDDAFFKKLEQGDPAAIPERNGAADIASMFCTSGTTSTPKLVVYDHAAYWLSGLSTLDMLGLTADDKTLEYRSFGWNSAQILSLMPFSRSGLTLHIAKALFAQPLLRMDPTLRAHLFRRRADGGEHAVEQTAWVYRRGHSDAAPDDVQHRAALARTVEALRGHVRADAAATLRHVGGRLDLRQPALQNAHGHGGTAGGIRNSPLWTRTGTPARPASKAKSPWAGRRPRSVI